MVGTGSAQRGASATSARLSGELVVESRVLIVVIVQHALAKVATTTGMCQRTWFRLGMSEREADIVDRADHPPNLPHSPYPIGLSAFPGVRTRVW